MPARIRRDFRIRPPHRQGLGQVEVVVSSLIVGAILVGALNVLGAATRTHRIAADYLDAPGLAHQLMGEILALPYEDPESPGNSIGLDAGETDTTRADFDDLDDYDGWNQDPPQHKDGTLVPAASGWKRQVWVMNFDPVSGSQGGSTDNGVKLIRLKIDPPSGPSFEIKALRSKWGSLEQPPGVDHTMITSIDAQLQIGSSSEPAVASIHLKNHANE